MPGRRARCRCERQLRAKSLERSADRGLRRRPVPLTRSRRRQFDIETVRRRAIAATRHDPGARAGDLSDRRHRGCAVLLIAGESADCTRHLSRRRAAERLHPRPQQPRGAAGVDTATLSPINASGSAASCSSGLDQQPSCRCHRCAGRWPPRLERQPSGRTAPTNHPASPVNRCSL